MQPTYLPWAGYFNLIKQVDKFVFLDDVQFERRSWQTRNRILLQGQEHTLTVPVIRHARSDLLKNISIDEMSGWRKSHWLTLGSAYQKTNYGHLLLGMLEPFYVSGSETSLSRLNELIIKRIATALSLNTIFYRASDLGCEGKRSAHLAKICENINCSEYFSPEGSREYLLDDKFSETFGLKVDFQSFVPKPYIQYKGLEFVSHLSILDVIANHGIEYAKSYIS